MKVFNYLNSGNFDIHICKTSSAYPHRHGYFELAYVLSGSAVHWLEGEERIIKKGDYFILDYDTHHNYVKNEQEDFELVNCLFLSEFIDKTLRNRQNFNDIVNNYMIKLNNSVVNVSPANHIYSDDDGYIGELLKRCLFEYQNKSSGYMEVIRSKLIEIIILTMRKNEEAKPVSTDYICDRILKYTAEHMAEKDILKNIGNELNFSVSYLSRRFKENIGISFTEYVQKLRIDQSMCMLGNTSKKITEIAEFCGYSDMKFFNSIFKKYAGMTPREFRNTFR